MLPDKSYYEDEGAKKDDGSAGKAFKKPFKNWATNEKTAIVKEALNLMKLAKYAQSNEEASEIKNLHHLRRQKTSMHTRMPLSFTI